MSDSRHREVERLLLREQEPSTDSKRLLIRRVWEERVLPTLRQKAHDDGDTEIQYQRRLSQGFHSVTALFDVLHDADANPRELWKHQTLDPFRSLALEPTVAGMGYLSQVAADYLAHPQIRTNYLDWVFLDVLVFAEWHARSEAFWSARPSGGIDFAWTFASDDQYKYCMLRILFSGLAFSARYLVVPALIIYGTFIRQQEASVAGLILLGCWVLYVGYRVASTPHRWMTRRKASKRLEALTLLYESLAGPTVSPKQAREAVERAVSAGATLDGAVFAIVDRMIARDATAFLPGHLATRSV